MENNTVILDFETWCEQFKPTGNPEEGSQSGFEIDGASRLFETYGSDICTIEKTLKTKGPGHVWTLVESDGDEIIMAGFARVNRLGYFITEVPWTNELTEVSIA